MEFLTGTFLGAVLAILVIKVFEVYQKKVDNEYSLSRIYFEKKLSAGEQFISNLYITYSSLVEIQKTLRTIGDDISHANSKALLELLKKHKEYLGTFVNEQIHILDPVLDPAVLYFDFDLDRDFFDETSESFKLLLPKFEQLAPQLSELIEKYSESDDPMWMSGFEKEFKEFRDKQQHAMQEAANHFSQMTEKNWQIIEKIRKEVRTYERLCRR